MDRSVGCSYGFFDDEPQKFVLLCLKCFLILF